MTATLELLGTGMSHGIPVIGCTCEACQSTDPHDNRLRTCALLRGPNTTLLIDCGPDFRVQALRTKLEQLNGALITHVHADHIFGLDDLRIFSFKKPFDIYGSQISLDDIKEHFDYIFKETQVGGGKPNFIMNVVSDPFEIAEIHVVPISLEHDYPGTLGYRFGNTAYLTDLFAMSDESYRRLEGVENVVINAVHPGIAKTHLSFEKALDIIEKIAPKKAYFTHIDHTMTHKKIIGFIQKEVEKRPYLKNIVVIPGFDGLVIDDVTL